MSVEVLHALTPRTQEQIVARIAAVSERDYLGFERGDLIDYLDFEHAKSHLKEGTTAEEWENSERKLPLDEIRSYMSFAFEKAHDQRGISASRSLSHMKSWLWLTGDDALSSEFDAMCHGYTNYGLPQLRWLCEKLAIDANENGDG